LCNDFVLNKKEILLLSYKIYIQLLTNQKKVKNSIMKNLFKSLMFLAVVGFLASCSQAPAGEEAKTGETKEVTQTEEAKTLNVDLAASKMMWEGSKVTGKHNGTINLKSGSLQVKGNELVGGSFVIDMNSIAVTDLKENQGKEKLEKHLKTGDFFETEKYSEGKFEITGVKAQAGEGTTHIVSGNLTLKDKSVGIEIPANVKIENGTVSATAPQFIVDRTKFGISSKAITDSFISDKLGIKFEVSAK
jgi:polyisoprenoid-binding protein YceI